MTDPSVRAIVDVHEPGEIGGHLEAHADVDDWGIHSLESADLVVCGVGFERKTPEDYAGSLTSGRLKAQVRKGVDAFEHFYILIEGDISDFDRLSHTRLSATSLRGSVASFSARDGVHTVFCGDARTLVDMAVRIGRKHTEDPSQVHLPSPDVEDAPTVLRMYACLPGIGPTLAATLHEAFPRPDVLLAADVDVIAGLDGFGPKTAQTVYDAVRGKA